MAKFNAGNAGQVKRLEASRAMDSNGIQDAIADKIQVGLTQDSVFPTEEGQYDNAVLPAAPVGVNDGKQEMLPVNNPEQIAALELQQQQRARSSSIQQLADTEVLSNWDKSSIAGIVGEANKPRLIHALTNLSKTDSVKIPVDTGLEGSAEKRNYVAQNMMNFKAPSVRVAEDPDAPKEKMVDAARTRPLTAANLFSHLGMIQETSPDDVRMFEVTSDAQVLGFVVMEHEYMRHMQERNIISPEMIDNFTDDEINQLTGLSSQDTESDISVGKLGNMYHEQLMMYQQVAQGGKDIIPDKHLDPANQLTKEAYEQLGLWVKQQYNLGNPANTKLIDVGTNGNTRYDYVLTPTGVLAIENARKDAIEPDVRIRTQIINDPKSFPAYQKDKSDTNKNFKLPSDKKRRLQPEVEAMSNTSAVKHIITPNRLKSGLLIALQAFKYASQTLSNDLVGGSEIQVDGQTVGINGRVVVESWQGNSLGIGQKMADKINNTAENLLLKAKALTKEIESDRMMNRPVDYDKQNQIRVLLDFHKTAQTNAWRKARYNQEATKALAMVQDVVEVYGLPIGFPTFLQSGTSRISYATQVMNVQNNKFARQLFGSGTKYEVKPNTNTNKEQAMLITWAGHFFTDGAFVPEKMLINMRERINSSPPDPKLMAIASVGKKLKETMDSYNTDLPVDSVLKMEIVNGEVQGVGAAINAPRPKFSSDDDVKRFLTEAAKHPNEVVNLIEEAIELSNYMDAVKSNGTIMSQMRPIEVDGIMNGIASMSAQLGIIDVMYRVGVLREHPEKVIADYQGLEGNLRDLMVNNMRESISDITVNPELMSKWGIDESNHTEIVNLLELAILNKDEFLKPPIMTFAYGQAIERMLGGVMNAISTDENLRAAALISSFGTAGTGKILHKILSRGLTETLSPEIVAFAEALKDMTQVGMLSNEPIRFVKATGTTTSSNSLAMQDTGDKVRSTIQMEYSDPVKAGRRFGDPKSDNPSTQLDEKGKPYEKAIRAELPMTIKKLTALGRTAQGGFSMRQGILAQAIISNDGSVFSKLMSGPMYKALQREAGSQVPYVSLIYDAFIGDLGSFIPLLKLSNQTWVNVNLKYDLIKSLADGAAESHARGKARINALAAKDPEGLVEDREHAEYVVGLAAELVKEEKGGLVYYRSSDSKSLATLNKLLTDLDALFDNRTQNTSLSSSKLRSLNDRSHMLTNRELADLFQKFTPRTMGKIARIRAIGNEAKKGRTTILNTLGSKPIIHEFAVDGLKEFNFN